MREFIALIVNYLEDWLILKRLEMMRWRLCGSLMDTESLVTVNITNDIFQINRSEWLIYNVNMFSWLPADDSPRTDFNAASTAAGLSLAYI